MKKLIIISSFLVTVISGCLFGCAGANHPAVSSATRATNGVGRAVTFKDANSNDVTVFLGAVQVSGTNVPAQVISVRPR